MKPSDSCSGTRLHVRGDDDANWSMDWGGIMR